MKKKRYNFSFTGSDSSHLFTKKFSKKVIYLNAITTKIITIAIFKFCSKNSYYLLILFGFISKVPNSGWHMAKIKRLFPKSKLEDTIVQLPFLVDAIDTLRLKYDNSKLYIVKFRKARQKLETQQIEDVEGF